MRAAVYVLLLFLVLALSVPGSAKAPDDNLIVPGQRIGKWTLDMTIDDLLKMNGPKNSAGMYGLRPVINAHSWSSTMRGEVWIHVWGGSGLLVGTFSQSSQRVVLLGTDNYVKTAQHIGTGSRQRDIEVAYGKPTATILTPPGQSLFHSRLIYDKRGLAFTMARDGTVLGAIVFRPGTAKRIWIY